MREIFTASFWRKQRKKYEAFEKLRRRWKLPLVLRVGLAMSLEGRGSVGERFERAREWVGAEWEKRKRCGKTVEGYLKALGEVPLKWFGDVRRQVQGYAEAKGLRVAQVGRWKAYGLDGTKQDVPRTKAHEEAYGLATKGPGAPQRMVVAAVGLGKEVLWDWESGGGLAGERGLCLSVVERLPEGSLAVCDAGLVGYEWCEAVRRSGRHFLVRVGGNVRLWGEQTRRTEWHEGEVWLWPKEQEEKGQAPLRLRLIRLERRRSKGRKRVGRKGEREEMWLVTDVLSKDRLTREEARRLYEKRWPASEGTFRTWKRTLEKAKMYSRTPEQTERESAFSLLALMVLEAMALAGRKDLRKRSRRKVSVAGAQRLWRRALREITRGKQAKWFRGAIAQAMVDCYRRRKPKVRRPWPQRKQHNSCKGPKILKLRTTRKRRGLQLLQEKKPCAS